jgi:hypothetical protein
MSEPQLPREVRRRLATIHPAEEVTGMGEEADYGR